MVVRFKADNPGVWPFHCHITWHFVMGMQVVIIEDQPPAPSSGIPVCGDVTPQMFADQQKSEISPTPDSNGSEDSEILLIFLIIGWILFALLLVLVIVMVLKLKQREASSVNVTMT